MDAAKGRVRRPRAETWPVRETILRILRPRGCSQIRSAVVQTIPVSMIDFDAIAWTKTKNPPVHPDADALPIAFAAAFRRMLHIADGVAIGEGPRATGDALKIGIIDHGEGHRG